MYTSTPITPSTQVPRSEPVHMDLLAQLPAVFSLADTNEQHPIGARSVKHEPNINENTRRKYLQLSKLVQKGKKLKNLAELLNKMDPRVLEEVLKIKNKQGNTLLFFTIQHGKLNFFELIFNKLTDPIAHILLQNNNNESALNLAVKHGGNEIFSILLGSLLKADCVSFKKVLEIYRQADSSPFFWECSQRDKERKAMFVEKAKESGILKDLLFEGDVNQDTSLMLAVEANDYQLVKEILNISIESRFFGEIISKLNNNNLSAKELAHNLERHDILNLINDKEAKVIQGAQASMKSSYSRIPTLDAPSLNC